MRLMCFSMGWQYGFRMGLTVALQNPANLHGIEVSMQVVVDHHDRRAVACSQADDWEQCKSAVRRGLARRGSEPLGEALKLAGRAHDPAAHAIAHIDYVPADRLAEDQVIE